MFFARLHCLPQRGFRRDVARNAEISQNLASIAQGSKGEMREILRPGFANSPTVPLKPCFSPSGLQVRRRLPGRDFVGCVEDLVTLAPDLREGPRFALALPVAKRDDPTVSGAS